MLTISKKSEYGLIALCQMAWGPERLWSARDIAARHHVPLPLLMNVLKQLGSAGLVESVRGAKGGYRLARDPAEISLSTLIEAIDGPVRFVTCADDEGHAGLNAVCERADECAIQRPLHRVHEAFCDFLRTISVAEIANDSAATTFTVQPRTARMATL